MRSAAELRILFVPVSGPFGMGEYARSLAIANACARTWPQAQLHFALSRHAPYAASVPYAATLLESSPTFHTKEMLGLLDSFRPTVVIFDNAGRTAQLRAARRRGARVVYISARARQRRKAFRWRWLQQIDEHWIAYPEFIAGSLSFFERLKLKLHPQTEVRFLDVIVAPAESAELASVVGTRSFLVLVPGGGTGHPGARDAITQFQQAAAALAGSGIPTILVGARERVAECDNLKLLGSLPQPELARLLRDARLAVTNGGSTLLQAIASGTACIAVPIAQDQAERIRRCVAAEVAVPARLDAVDIVGAATALWTDDATLMALAQRARELHLADGVQVAIAALTRLLH